MPHKATFRDWPCFGKSEDANLGAIMSESTVPLPSSLPARLVRLYGGLALYGLGIALPLESGLGNSPWNVFHEGAALRTGLSIGTVILAVGALVMLLWIPLKQKPGLGTISNVLLVGPFADAAVFLLPTPELLVFQIFYCVLGVVVIALSTLLYIGAGLGPGPRDGIMTGLVRLGMSVRVSRLSIEVAVLIAGWLLGGTVGLGTVVFALAIGPLTQAFTRWFPLT
uniref:FIG00761799: membrane protein n=2 Tax=Nonomuraea gerenzanensis TaxID=93944 RepID=A0A1M4EGI6_9ACTN|nr:FIG00761799: membrane protein [Nonomuraea gerenzanensis]